VTGLVALQGRLQHGLSGSWACCCRLRLDVSAAALNQVPPGARFPAFCPCLCRFELSAEDMAALDGLEEGLVTGEAGVRYTRRCRGATLHVRPGKGGGHGVPGAKTLGGRACRGS
jgi:hypothetical protein